MKRAITAVLCVAMLTAAGLLAAGCQKDEPGAAAPAAAAEIKQKTCPVMGGKIDPTIYADHEGRRIYFCCAACVARFKAEPEKYLAKVDEELKAAGG